MKTHYSNCFVIFSFDFCFQLESMFKDSLVDQVKQYNVSGESQLDFIQVQVRSCRVHVRLYANNLYMIR